MSEIYLAASSRTDINLLGKAVHTKMKGTEVIEVTKEGFQDVLYSDFQLLVISPDFLSDPSKIALGQLKGKKLCYWHKDYIPQIVDSRLYVFPDIKSVYQWLVQGAPYKDEGAFIHSEGEIIKKGDGSNSAQAKVRTEKSVEQAESASHSSGDKAEASSENLEEDKEDEGSEVNIDTGEDDNELNHSKPVSVIEPYPELEDKVKQRLEYEAPEEDDDNLPIEPHSSPTPEIQYEEDPFSERAIAIRKEAFSNASWDRNRTIGIWSPLHRMGVTTLTFNISLYFGNLKIPTAAVEGLTNNQHFKTMLSQYCSVPEGWVSFLSALQDEKVDATKVEWTFGNVHWLPIGDHDIDRHEWTPDHLKHYFNSAKYFDLVFVDLPTGKMAQHTLDTIRHLDELWILIDGSYDQVLAWKKYIHSVLKEYDLTVKLIFVKEYSFSKPKKVAEKLDLPLLATIPDLSEAIYRNYSERKPLIDQPDTYRLLEMPLNKISEHLLGEEFMMTQKVPLFKKLKWFLHT